MKESLWSHPDGRLRFCSYALPRCFSCKLYKMCGNNYKQKQLALIFSLSCPFAILIG